MRHLTALDSIRPDSDDRHMTDASRGRILVVDDEPTIAEIVSRYLERGGYETRIAADGHAALARASTWHPDLVVLDLMLPGLDGSWPPTRARASRRATASGSSRRSRRVQIARRGRTAAPARAGGLARDRGGARRPHLDRR